MIKVALFDIDGVIVKDPIFSTVYANEHGLTPEAMLPFFTKAFQDCMIGKADLKVAVAPFLKEWKWTGTVDEFITYWLEHHRTLDPDVITILENLRAKGIKIVLATNQEKYRADYLWNVVGLKNYCDDKIVSYTLGVRKPNKDYFIQTLKLLGLAHEPNAVLLVDDSLNFIMSAETCGIQTHYYKNASGLRSALHKLGL